MFLVISRCRGLRGASFPREKANRPLRFRCRPSGVVWNSLEAKGVGLSVYCCISHFLHLLLYTLDWTQARLGRGWGRGWGAASAGGVAISCFLVCSGVEAPQSMDKTIDDAAGFRSSIRSSPNSSGALRSAKGTPLADCQISRSAKGTPFADCQISMSPTEHS